MFHTWPNVIASQVERWIFFYLLCIHALLKKYTLCLLKIIMYDSISVCLFSDYFLCSNSFFFPAQIPIHHAKLEECNYVAVGVHNLRITF
jgi:hypothetical protein